MADLPVLDDRIQGIRRNDRSYVAVEDVSALMRRVARIYMQAEKDAEATATYRIAEALDLHRIEVMCPTVDSDGGEGW